MTDAEAALYSNALRIMKDGRERTKNDLAYRLKIAPDAAREILKKMTAAGFLVSERTVNLSITVWRLKK